jgi:hypothetical protein
MLFFAVLLVQIALLPPAISVLSRQRLGLYTCFYGVFCVLIVIPFYLIFAEVQGVIHLEEIVGKSADAKVTLDVGNGFRPLMWVCLAQACYLAGGYFVMNTTTPALTAPKLEPTSMMYLGVGLAIFGICYTLIRFWLVPDFPLFVLLTTGSTESLRDLSFEYATRKDVPYIFLPSINANVRRILLPVAAFLLGRSATHSDNKFVKILYRITLVLAITVIVGQFKRAPLCYIVLWCVLQRHAFADIRRLGRIMVVSAVLIIIMIGITGTYQQGDEFDLMKAVLSLFWRLFVGEAIGEFLALEHHGITYDYRGLEIFQTYFQKVIGADIMTFSEYWKAEVGGKRGYMAVGVITEIFISVGPMAATVLWALTGMCLVGFDRLLMRYNSDDHRPFIAGLIVVFAFSSVKGGLSQFFTGGGLVLLVLYFGTVFVCRQVPPPPPLRRPTSMPRRVARQT